jgi:hypothetical protein
VLRSPVDISRSNWFKGTLLSRTAFLNVAQCFTIRFGWSLEAGKYS